MYYFNFNSSEERDNIYTKIENKINVKSLDIIINDWKYYRISNMELLMWINIYSNRSFNDISQYPVLPWVIGDYNSEILPEKIFCEENNLKLNFQKQKFDRPTRFYTRKYELINYSIENMKLISSLRVSQKFRLIGFREENAFNIIWFDKNHEVY